MWLDPAMNDDLKKYTPKIDKPMNLDRQMCIVRYSPCGKILAAGGSDATVRRWDASGATLTPLPNLTGHHGWVQAMAFGKETLYTGDSWGELRSTPFLDKEPKPAWTVSQAHDGWLRCIAVSPDGKQLATCGMDRKVRLWDTAKGTKLKEWADHDEDVLTVTFAPDGQSLVSGDLKGKLRQLDVASGKITRILDASSLYMESRLQDVGGSRSLAFNPAGTLLACSGTKPSVGGNVQGIPTILIFDWKTGKLDKTLSHGAQGDGFIYEVHWHSAGFLMGVTSGNPGVGKLVFHRPEEDKPFFLGAGMANCHSLAIHPDGKRLMVSATNANSNGNGRPGAKEYLGNFSPLFGWTMPA